MKAYRFSPSERTATTLRQFLEACQAEPHVAAEHLQEGYFEPWLSDAGRHDLAQVAARIRLSGVAAVAGLQQFLQAAMAASAPARPRARSATRKPPAVTKVK